MWMVLCLLSFGYAADEGLMPAPAVRTERLADGSVKVVPDRQVPGSMTRADGVVLEFAQINLFDLTLYMADLMRRNVLIADEEALRGKVVRFVGHTEMTVPAAWQAYLSSLKIHGFSTNEGTGGLVHIVPKEVAGRGNVTVGEGPPAAGEAITTRLLAVRSARARDLVPILTPLLSKDAQVVAYAPSNTLIVTDVASHVRKAYDLVTALDVTAPESSMRLTRLEHADASAVRAVLEALYPANAVAEPAAPQPSRVRRRGKRAATNKASKGATTSGSEAQRISKILNDERTNSLVVLANAEGHAAVARVVAELDIDVDPSVRRSLHVVQLDYAIAEEVAAVLGALSGERRSERARPRGRDNESAPDPLAVLDGDLRIAPDPATNSLAVVAGPQEFELVSHLIAELDVARGQVFVDAVFVELTEGEGEELSLGAHTVTADGGVASLQTDPDAEFNSLSISSSLLSGLAAGVFGPLIEVVGPTGALQQVPTFGVALQALQTHSDVRLMGNPALVTLDHQEATLTVGERIPFATSNTLTAVGNTQSFERLDVGTELVVTPHINGDGLVTMDIQLTVDEAQESGGDTAIEGGPRTSGRKVESRVMVQDGETVVIAGMSSTKTETRRTKVPVLGDIPLLGLLFRGRATTTRDTNLLVFLTPYVLESPRDLLEIRRMKEAQRGEFLRRFQGKAGGAWVAELNALLIDAHDGDATVDAAP